MDDKLYVYIGLHHFFCAKINSFRSLIIIIYFIVSKLCYIDDISPYRSATASK